MAAIDLGEDRRRRDELEPLPLPGNRGSDAPTFSLPGGPVQESQPQQQSGFDPSKVPSGVPQDWAQDFIARNPGDYHRIQDAYQIPTSHRPYDSQSSVPFEQTANQQADIQRDIQRAFGTPQTNPWGALAANTAGGGAWHFGGQPGINLPGQIFDDPTTKLLEDLIKGQIGQLTQPINDPTRGQYQASLQSAFDRMSAPQAGTPVPGGGATSQEQLRALLQQQIQQYSRPDTSPHEQQYVDQLRQQINFYGQPRTAPHEQQYADLLQQQIARFANPSSDEAALTNFMRQQFQELSGTPGYSPEERALLNTQALEPIEALRKASQERQLQRTAQAGYLPTSGLHNERATQADLLYDQMRTQANRDLAVQAIDRRDADLARAMQVGGDLLDIPLARQREAIGLSGNLADFGIGQQSRQDEQRSRAIGLSGNLADFGIGQQQRTDQRNANALDLSRGLADYDTTQSDREETRLGRASGIAGLLAALSRDTRGEEQSRQNQAIQLAGMLHQLPIQAQNQAMAVINGTAPPESLLPVMMQLAQSGQVQNQQYYQILGQLAALFD